MSRELQRIRDRNLQFRAEAVGAAIKQLSQYAPAPFTVSDWSRSAEEAYSEQWCKVPRHPDGGWDWPEMRRRYRAPDDQFLVIRSGERLSALGLVTVANASVKLAFLEGDPRSDCPLRRFRTVLALDIAAFYGQRLGRKELRLEPVNSTVKALYVDRYGFEEVAPARGTPYLKKDL